MSSVNLRQWFRLGQPVYLYTLRFYLQLLNNCVYKLVESEWRHAVKSLVIYEIERWVIFTYCNRYFFLSLWKDTIHLSRQSNPTFFNVVKRCFQSIILGESVAYTIYGTYLVNTRNSTNTNASGFRGRVETQDTLCDCVCRENLRKGSTARLVEGCDSWIIRFSPAQLWRLNISQ